MTPALEQPLAENTRQHLELETLEKRSRDRLDFHIKAVAANIEALDWLLREAAGRAAEAHDLPARRPRSRPFLRLGSTSAAAALSGRHRFGIEIEADYCNHARQRLAGAARYMRRAT